eukprot:3357429-Pyramimonas_sp.AAC.1
MQPGRALGRCSSSCLWWLLLPLSRHPPSLQPSLPGGPAAPAALGAPVPACSRAVHAESLPADDATVRHPAQRWQYTSGSSCASQLRTASRSAVPSAEPAINRQGEMDKQDRPSGRTPVRPGHGPFGPGPSPPHSGAVNNRSPCRMCASTLPPLSSLQKGISGHTGTKKVPAVLSGASRWQRLKCWRYSSSLLKSGFAHKFSPRTSLRKKLSTTEQNLGSM